MKVLFWDDFVARMDLLSRFQMIRGLRPAHESIENAFIMGLAVWTYAHVYYSHRYSPILEREGYGEELACLYPDLTNIPLLSLEIRRPTKVWQFRKIDPRI